MVVRYPSIVEEALKEFGDLFRNEPERRHLADYLTGLLVAEKKTVSGISRELVFGTDQSCLNRWLTEVGWDEHALNDRRLELMQRQKRTRYDARGVISIDNTLIDHEGKLIEDVGWFWDHAEGRYKIAHDLIISNYVTPFGAHYPIEWRRFKKKDTAGEEFRDHTQLCIDLIEDAIARDIPGDFTFDSYFTSAKVLNHIHEKQRNYVGDLKLNRRVVFQGRESKLSEVAKQIPPEAKREVHIGERSYFAFTSRMRLPEVTHPVRVVLFWKKREDQEASKALITNRLSWEIIRILLVYRSRWTGTETFHRDGKQELGLGDCQVGKGEGQTRHIYLVSTAYSLLMRALNGAGPKEWVKQRLTTIGQACRAIKEEMLGSLVDWIVDRLSHNWSPGEIKMLLRIN